MDFSSRLRPPTRRKPLEDATSRGNQGATPPRSTTKTRNATSISLPHHESLMADGPLTVRNATSSPAHQRLSAITNDDQSDSKRNSQVSTTSTNASSKGRRRKTHIGPWQLGNDVGKGGCGKVRKVRHSVTGQIAAVKIISKFTAEKARAESLANLVESSKRPRAGALAAPINVMPFGIEREVVIMKLLQHDNIVKLYDVWENRNELYLIMEYVNGGELFEHIDECECLAEDETVYLFRQIVAALLHCHRLGIHHRDLKPENILIEKRDGRIKLVDFGMAALQPRGTFLTTPCGSLHYAAPEVFEKNYDGSKVDVWSLGIILYVMLTGTTPFQYDVSTMANNVQLWYNVLKAGVFEMPEDLSMEAQDLIKKMLVPNPQHRITLDATWKHPFMHKYDTLWDETPENNRIENWIGPPPLIQDWVVKKRGDIDREIFRNLRSLWHSETEDVLLEKLLSKEPNQEKYFYSALQKHREEQLENYVGIAEGITHSTSDHHHIKPVYNPRDIPPVPSLPPKSKSQYSILNDEHLNSRSTLHDPPPSIGSYDPYRASRDPVAGHNEDYIKLNVLGSHAKNRRNSITSSLKPPASHRIETLRNGQRRISAASSSASLHHSSPSQRRALSRRSMSRSSLGSSLFPSSPPTGVIVSGSRKRPVNFSHLRRSSTASALTSHSGGGRAPITPRKVQLKKLGQHDKLQQSPGVTSSPVALLNTVVRSRKEVLRSKSAERPQHNSEVIDREARKLSTELEKYCEEVFFRTSTGSSSRTSATPSGVVDSPPSSVSNRGSGSRAAPKVPRFDTDSQRPLPALPMENSSAVIKQELIETRKRLAARLAQDENAQNEKYQEVLAHLDALLQSKTTHTGETDYRRPTSTTATRQSYLPIISEEDRSEAENSHKSRRGATKDSLAMPTFSFNGPPDEPSDTVRIAPLVIRKTSGSSTASQTLKDARMSSTVYRNPGWAKSTGKLGPSSPVSPNKSDEEDHLNKSTSHSERGKENPQIKKGNWFQRKLRSNDSSEQSEPKKALVELDDPTGRSTREDPMAKQAAGGLPGKRPGFLRMLAKKQSPRGTNRQILVAAEDDDDTPSIASTAGFSNSDRGGPSSFRHNHTLDAAEQNDPRDLGVQQSWLARFFHLKPASHALCFCVGRGRARQEIVRVLRGWKQFGMRDVILDRARNLVFARLDAVNHLGIKEVSFVVEMYVMLEQGRKARLSVCRFTQRKGAASSFRRVIEAVESVLRGKGVLVDRGEMWREMEGVLASG